MRPYPSYISQSPWDSPFFPSRESNPGSCLSLKYLEGHKFTILPAHHSGWHLCHISSPFIHCIDSFSLHYKHFSVTSQYTTLYMESRQCITNATRTLTAPAMTKMPSFPSAWSSPKPCSEGLPFIPASCFKFNYQTYMRTSQFSHTSTELQIWAVHWFCTAYAVPLTVWPSLSTHL